MIGRMIRRHRKRIEAALLPHKRSVLGEHTMIGVDVGSAEGMQPHWRAYEGLVDFYLFEPHAESAERLRASLATHPYARNFHIVPVGLSGTGGERTLYMLNCPTGTSLYPIDTDSEAVDQNDSYIYPIREVQISTHRLADVLERYDLNRVDIIKLDVQGAELEILEGLGHQRRTNLLLVEAEVNVFGGVSRNSSLYKGAPTWTQLDQLLVAEGMRLLDVSMARGYRARGGDSDWYQREIFDVYSNSPSLAAHAWEVDVVYVRDWRTLLADRDATSVRRLAVALCGYRFFSEAYFIIEEAEKAGLFDKRTADSVKSGIVAWHRAGRRFWHGRSGIWRKLRRVMRATGMSQLLRWKQYMWFDYPNG